MSRYWRDSWLVLALALGFGLALAAVERAIRPRIEEHARARLEEAVLEVVPGGAAVEPRSVDGRGVHEVFAASGAPAGWAFAAEAPGFQDRIRVMIGVDPEAARVVGLAVVECRETPGLGDRIREREFRDRFAGRTAAPPLGVDAITGATISSEAVVRAVEVELERTGGAIRREVARRRGP